MEKGNIREIREVSMAELIEKAGEKHAIRVGSTKRDPETRAKEYEREMYSGIMYVSKTTNMRYAEDRLLELGTIHNEQQSSNAPEEKGFVYVIQGKNLTKIQII